MKNKKNWIIRTLQVALLASLIGVIIYQLISLQTASNAVRYQQTDKFSYSLTNIAAAEAARYLAQKKQDNLKSLVNNISNDPMVRDATIYDHLGKIVHQSEKALPLGVLLNLGENEKQHSAGLVPYIAELYQDKTKIGYLRVTVKQDKILSLIQDYQDRGFAILCLLILLAFIIGVILMAIFYKKAEKTYERTMAEFPKLIQLARKDALKMNKTSSK